MTLRLGRHSFPDDRRLMMAIVNRTPDSFYDQGATWSEDKAFERVAEVVEQGAEIVDIGGIKAAPGFLKFCQRLGVGSSFLKSSSYLMFENGFTTIRNFILEHSRIIVQDDAGIPLAYIDPGKWNLRFFGVYLGPINLFKQHYQPRLQQLFAQSNPPPLEFGFGYRWNYKEANVIVATRK